jgi:hypothetical protein
MLYGHFRVKISFSSASTEVTGAARLYRAASGGPQGWAPMPAKWHYVSEPMAILEMAHRKIELLD